MQINDKGQVPKKPFNSQTRFKIRIPPQTNIEVQQDLEVKRPRRKTIGDYNYFKKKTTYLICRDQRPYHSLSETDYELMHIKIPQTSTRASLHGLR